jgi:2-dehydropantoate 2-reductase
MENQPGPLRVAIVGVGGVGGFLGALLSRQGEEVRFVATESTAAILAERGLRIRSARYGSVTADASAVTMLSAPVDVCVFAVKATQLGAAMGRVPADTLGDAVVVPFLNGVEHVGSLREQTGPESLPPRCGSRRRERLVE